ncbi:hypothetical protein ACFVQ0_15740 [Streptomyces sp. NPDC057900]|uniref:hypothetical protein n=1 Tax=Streptomyces sp. NPDC057900 TaxID=3346274 RepID=UPI0036E36823
MRSHPESEPPPRPGWAHAAALWLAVSFVWHLQMGVMYEDAIGPGSHGDAEIAVFLAYDGLITLMSAAGVGCVLATVRPWGARVPRWMVRGPLLFGCALLTLRGLPGLIENITVATGLTPHGLLGMEDEAIDAGSRTFWKSIVINSYFFLGAFTLIPATRRYTRRLRAPHQLDV